MAWLILDCARRTSTFRACAFREQEDDQVTRPSCFSIRLELVLCHAIPQRIPGDLEEPAGFGDIAACALERFL